MLVALLAVMALALPGLSTPAQAAVNAAIKVSNLKLAKIDAAENPDSGQLVMGSSIALLTFDWSAADGAIKDGDSFTIGLPDPFLGARVQGTESFTYDFGQGQVEVGSCVIATASLTCTFNETMAQKVAAGYTGVAGSGKLQLAANKATDKVTLPFSINGEDVEVPLPDKGGIIKNQSTYNPAKLWKGAAGISEKSQEITWVVTFGTKHLQAELARNGKNVTFDGKTSQTITMTDMLGPGMMCMSETQAKDILLARTTSAVDPQEKDRLDLDLDRGSAGPTTSKAGTFEVTATCGQPTSEGTPIKWTVTGPFAEETNYYINYRVSPTSDDGLAVPGFVYSNTISIDGTSFTSSPKKSFVRSFSLTIKMEKGYGSFSVAKYVEGVDAATVPAGTAFTVNVAYELPAGTTSADYPAWQAPGTLNADKRTGVASFEVAMGERTLFVGPKPSATFPKGTKVTLSEPTSSVALPQGMAWGPAVFKTPAGETSVLTIGDDIVNVDLTNTVVQRTGTFSVTKKLNAPADFQGPASYDFTYTCTAPDGRKSTGEGTVPAGGTWKSGQIPAGLTCSVQERDIQVEGYDLSVDNGQGVEIAPDADQQVTITNTYTAVRKAAVSVGNYVWEDVDKDGLQDKSDKPIPGVTLTISRSDGAQVTKADGSVAATSATTDSNGAYAFTGLEALPAGTHYVVTVAAVEGYEPTTPGVGDDRAVDSSTDRAESTDLVNDGDADMSLDFGFVKKAEPTTPAPSAPTPDSSASATPPATPGAKPTGGLARTGATLLVPLVLAASALGGGVLLMRRRRQD